MSTRLRRFVALAAVVALPLGTAACSDDDSDTDEPTEQDSGTDGSDTEGTDTEDDGADDGAETDDGTTDDGAEDGEG